MEKGEFNILGMPGNDLLSHSSSTIGAGAFHGRVRDGIEWGRSAIITRQTKDVGLETRRQSQRVFSQNDLSCLFVSSLAFRVSMISSQNGIHPRLRGDRHFAVHARSEH